MVECLPSVHMEVPKSHPNEQQPQRSQLGISSVESKQSLLGAVLQGPDIGIHRSRVRVCFLCSSWLLIWLTFSISIWNRTFQCPHPRQKSVSSVDLQWLSAPQWVSLSGCLGVSSERTDPVSSMCFGLQGHELTAFSLGWGIGWVCDQSLVHTIP